MAKNRLVVDYQYNFVLLRLNANVKPHKLAWAINNELKLDFNPRTKYEFGVYQRPVIVNNKFYGRDRTSDSETYLE